MNNDNLEEILVKTVVPPSGIVNNVTPWKKSINKVLIGLVLTTIAINISFLGLIQTFIGCVFLMLGYRALQHENKWFKASYYVVILKNLCVIFDMAVNSTIFSKAYYDSAFSILFRVFNLILQLLLFILLHNGFNAVREKAKFSEKNKSTVALIILYIVICLFAFLNLKGFAVFITLIVYGCIIRNLYKLSKGLSDSGYAIETKPFKLSEKHIVCIISLILIISMLCGYSFFDTYKMNWVKRESTENSEVQKIKSDLIEKGFPEYVLIDLKDADILSCKDAVKIVTHENEYPVNDGKVITHQGDDGKIYTEKIYEVKELLLTGVAVLVNESVNNTEKEEWVVFHHFLWQKNPGFCGTETIKLWPTHYTPSNRWTSTGEISGQLLYNLNGTTYTSDYYSVEEATRQYQSSGLMNENELINDTFASFSLPNEGNNHRGYLTYKTIGDTDMSMFDSWINYYHQQSKVQYPVITAEQYALKNSIGSNDFAFKLIQDALQF